jgi:hypothetical protein
VVFGLRLVSRDPDSSIALIANQFDLQSYYKPGTCLCHQPFQSSLSSSPGKTGQLPSEGAQTGATQKTTGFTGQFTGLLNMAAGVVAIEIHRTKHIISFLHQLFQFLLPPSVMSGVEIKSAA